jgi:hypothetical protein
MPDEDSHLAVHARSQAHESGPNGRPPASSKYQERGG